MGDQLDEFIKRNRAQFDNLEPQKNGWERIDAKLLEQPATNRMGWIWKVAAVLFLLSTIFLIWERSIKPSENIVQFPREFLETERYYLQEIEQQFELVSQFDLVDPLFSEDLEMLDEAYQLLKEDFSKSQSSDFLIDAMIQNLQIRMDILETQIEVLKKSNERSSDEEIQII